MDEVFSKLLHARKLVAVTQETHFMKYKKRIHVHFISNTRKYMCTCTAARHEPAASYKYMYVSKILTNNNKMLLIIHVT